MHTGEHPLERGIYILLAGCWIAKPLPCFSEHILNLEGTIRNHALMNFLNFMLCIILVVLIISREVILPYILTVLSYKQWHNSKKLLVLFYYNNRGTRFLPVERNPDFLKPN